MPSLHDVTDEYIRTKIIEYFTNMETPHGTVFDDHRRWCGGCERPVLSCEPCEELPWADRICPDCRAVWPEYVDDYILASDEVDGEALTHAVRTEH